MKNKGYIYTGGVDYCYFYFYGINSGGVWLDNEYYPSMEQFI